MIMSEAINWRVSVQKIKESDLNLQEHHLHRIKIKKMKKDFLRQIKRVLHKRKKRNQRAMMIKLKKKEPKKKGKKIWEKKKKKKKKS